MIQNKGQDVVVLLLQCVHSCVIRIIREIKTFVNVFVSFFTNGCFEPDENGNTVPPARCTRGSGSAVGERVTGGDIHCSWNTLVQSSFIVLELQHNGIILFA